MQKIRSLIVLFVLIFLNATSSFPQENLTSELEVVDKELEQELKWLKAETYVITASKVMEEIGIQEWLSMILLKRLRVLL